MDTKPDQAVVVDYRSVWSGGATEEIKKRMLLCCGHRTDVVNCKLHASLGFIRNISAQILSVFCIENVFQCIYN